jgi:hypothetical protein
VRTTTAQQTWITSHVERCLQQVFDNPDLVTDPDGDYPYRCGTAACWVSVNGQEPHFVRTFAHAAFGLRPTAKLLRELNDINTRTTTPHAYLTDGVVVVEQTLHPAGVTPESLRQAVGSVGQVADDIGHLIASVHGGATPFASCDNGIEEEA